jgi:hypothetical protein
MVSQVRGSVSSQIREFRGLRGFKIPELHRFATSELRKFKISDLYRFATSELRRFKIPDLHRFATLELRRFKIPVFMDSTSLKTYFMNFVNSPTVKMEENASLPAPPAACAAEDASTPPPPVARAAGGWR